MRTHSESPICDSFSGVVGSVSEEERDPDYAARVLDAAVRRKTAVDGNYDSGDELRSGREQPEHRAEQVTRLAKARHGRVPDDRFAAGGQVARVLVEQQKTILVGKEKPRRNRVHADLW